MKLEATITSTEEAASIRIRPHTASGNDGARLLGATVTPANFREHYKLPREHPLELWSFNVGIHGDYHTQYLLRDARNRQGAFIEGSMI